MKKLAITGITGKNGKVLFEYLLKNQDTVLNRWSGIKFLIRSRERALFLENASFAVPFEMVEGDARNEDSVFELLTDCDTILHISGIPYSLNIIKNAIKTNTKRMILVHTTGIYSKYKAAGETYRRIEEEVKNLVEEHQLALTILRPTMIYGLTNDHNISVFIDMVRRMSIIPVINGARYELQPVNYRDLGKAFYQVLMNPNICDGKEYILSGDRPITLREVFIIIAKELGVRRHFISCPYLIAYAGACGLYICTGKKKDFREKVQRMCESRAYNHQKATDDFGYDPMKIEDGIKKEVQMYLKTGLLK